MDSKMIVSVFQSALATSEAALELGRRDRERIRKQIQDGQKPTGYRVEWIKDSAQRVISTLGEVAKEFNEKHPNDRVSSHDLVDVLVTTLNYFKVKLEESSDD